MALQELRSKIFAWENYARFGMITTCHLSATVPIRCSDQPHICIRCLCCRARLYRVGRVKIEAILDSSCRPPQSRSFFWSLPFTAMPLILLTGFPSSGKTHRAKQIEQYMLERLKAEGRSMRIHIINDDSLNVSKDAYQGKWNSMWN